MRGRFLPFRAAPSSSSRGCVLPRARPATRALLRWRSSERGRRAALRRLSFVASRFPPRLEERPSPVCNGGRSRGGLLQPRVERQVFRGSRCFLSGNALFFLGCDRRRDGFRGRPKLLGCAALCLFGCAAFCLFALVPLVGFACGFDRCQVSGFLGCAPLRLFGCAAFCLFGCAAFCLFALVPLVGFAFGFDRCHASGFLGCSALCLFGCSAFCLFALVPLACLACGLDRCQASGFFGCSAFCLFRCAAFCVFRCAARCLFALFPLACLARGLDRCQASGFLGCAAFCLFALFPLVCFAFGLDRSQASRLLGCPLRLELEGLLPRQLLSSLAFGRFLGCALRACLRLVGVDHVTLDQRLPLRRKTRHHVAVATCPKHPPSRLRTH
jgi:hypothetical protein